MPRVLFITTEDITGTSGANISTAELVRAMANSANIDLSLIAPAPDSSSNIPDSVSTHWLSSKPAGTIRWHLRHQPSMARALITAIVAERPDQVIIRIGPSSVLPMGIRLLPSINYTVLIRGIVHRNLSIQRPVKGVIWANATVADETVVAFEAIAEVLRKLGVRREMKVIPNAVDPARFTPDDGPAPDDIGRMIDNKSFVIGFVGSMEERHDVDTLVKAVGSLPSSMEIALILVGDGPQRSALEILVNQVGIRDSTAFVGAVAHESVPRYISSCDVLYGISDPEKPSNPIKIYEYLSCERPVVTTQTPELEFVEDEELGVVMEDVDLSSVHDALVNLYQTPPDERKAMGRRGREYVARHHSWSTVVTELVRGQT